MPKFRKKAVEIEAIQHTRMEKDATGDYPVFETEPPDWLKIAMQRAPGATGAVFWDVQGLKIQTLEGVMLAGPGDWLIRGVKGEIYPCKDEIFSATYDAV